MMQHAVLLLALLAAASAAAPSGVATPSEPQDVGMDSLYYKWYGQNYLYRGDTAGSAPVQSGPMTWRYTQSMPGMDPYGEYIFEVYSSYLRRFDLQAGTYVDLTVPTTGMSPYYPCGTDGRFLYYVQNDSWVVKATLSGVYVSTGVMRASVGVTARYGFGVARDTVWCLSTTTRKLYGYPCSAFPSSGVVPVNVVDSLGPVAASVPVSITWDGNCFYTSHGAAATDTLEKWNADRSLRWRKTVNVQSRAVMAKAAVRQYDVTARTIVSPPAYVPSLGAQTPRATVRNVGAQPQPAPFYVKFRASGPGGNYLDSALCPALAAGAETTLTFATWNITARGRYSIACSTMSPADSNVNNNRAAGTCAAGVMRALILHADNASSYPGWLADSLNTYFGNDLYVDTMNVGTYGGNTRYAPSVDYLMTNGYRAILTYANYGYVNAAALGDTLAAYLESSGGGVAWAPYGNSYTLGRFTQYYTPNVATSSNAGAGSMGTVHQPTHKVMENVTGFSFNTYTWRDSLLRRSTAYRVCDFSGGNRIAVACNETLARRTAYLGFFPVARFYSGATGNWLQLVRNTLLWLGTNHDVGVRRIVAPAGLIDSGTVVAPACTVRNYGTETEDYKVYLRIGTLYSDSATVTGHSGGTDVYVTFPSWTALTRGNHQVACSTALGIDMRPSNNRLQGTCFVRVQDVAAQSVTAPSGSYQPGDVVVPRATYRNVGNTPASFEAWMVLYDAVGTRVAARKVDINSLPGGTSMMVSTFAPCTLTAIGSWTARCSTYTTADVVPANNYIDRPFAVGGADAGISAIVAPVGDIDSGAAVVPRVTVVNNGTWAVSFDVYCFIMDSTRVRIYSNSKLVVGLAGGATQTVTFDAWPKPHELGAYSVKCSTYLGGDNNPANDTRTGTFNVNVGGSPSSPWSSCAPMPDAPSSRQVKDGGWITYHDGTELAYAAKGYKTADFYCYSPAADTWSQLALIPDGVEAKKPSKGAVGCAGGDFVYATKGNNTQGFFRYDPANDSWRQLKDVSLGASNKRVKGGTGIAHVVDGVSEYVYLLKGYKNEFLRYDVANDSWTSLAAAPLGTSGKDKYDKGSWLVSDGTGLLYAHKAKYNELFAYDVTLDSWTGQLAGMPFISSTGKSKKSKDGGCAAWAGSALYALKGGGTQEFWKYAPDSALGMWAERDTLPLFGTGGKKKKVKAGAGITAVGYDLYALKGNKSNELWKHAANRVLLSPPPARSGAMAVRTASDDVRFAVAPNPLSTRFATVRLGSPQARTAVLQVYDAVGRCLLTTAVNTRASSVRLDLKSIPAGIYMVKLTAGAYTATQKLVVQD